MLYEEELTVALRAVHKAIKITTHVQENLEDVVSIDKVDRTPVTIADLGSQAVIIQEILSAYPQNVIIGEEDATILRKQTALGQQVLDLVNREQNTFTKSELLNAIDYGSKNSGSAERFWTLDPIDGTIGFLRGEQYAVALALIENRQVVLGVLGCPNYDLYENKRDGSRGKIFYATRDGGAFVQSIQTDSINAIHVNKISKPGSVIVCESVEGGHIAFDVHDKVSKVLGYASAPYRIDSQAKYAAVAHGAAGVYLRVPQSKTKREKIWDHAAGFLIVTEAGGTVTDIFGRPLQFRFSKNLENNFGIIASNGLIHDEVVKVISEVLKE